MAYILDAIVVGIFVLAVYLGVDRSGLSSEIGKLKREHVLKNEKNHFTLL